MSTDNTGQPDPDNTGQPDPDNTGQPDPDEKDGEPDTVARTELDKAVARRDKAIKAARDLKAELDKLKNPDSKDTEPDPVSVANARLVRAEAKSVLASVAGVTNKEDVATVLDAINLSGVEVDDDGEVDTDALEGIVTRLQKVFGGTEKRKAPKVVTRDRGGSTSGPADPDASRYRTFLGHGAV